jgi:hypothetical protein
MQQLARQGALDSAAEQGAREGARAVAEGAVRVDPAGIYATVDEAVAAARVAFAHLQTLWGCLACCSVECLLWLWRWWRR